MERGDLREDKLCMSHMKLCMCLARMLVKELHYQLEELTDFAAGILCVRPKYKTKIGLQVGPINGDNSDSHWRWRTKIPAYIQREQNGVNSTAAESGTASLKLNRVLYVCSSSIGNTKGVKSMMLHHLK